MRIITGDEALRTRQDSQFLPNFSKQYESGMTAITYYTLVFNEMTKKKTIIVGAGWGHKVDFNRIPLNRSFIATNAVMKENKPTTTDTLMSFSRLSSVYLDGERAFKIQMANASGQPAPILTKLLDDIEDEFEGNADKKIIRKSAAVGPLTYLITTECVFVPLDSDGKPKVADVRLCTQELSNKKLEQISTAINDRRMIANEENHYVELQYAFGNTKDKKQDGQVAPTGTPNEMELRTMYASEWDSIMDAIKKLPADSEQIMARNRAFDQVPEEEIVAGISAYAAGQNIYLNMIDESDKKNINKLKANAALLIELNADITIPEVKEAMNNVGKESEVEVASRTQKLLEADVKSAIEGNEDDRDEIVEDAKIKTKAEIKAKESVSNEESGIEGSSGF